MRRLFFRFVLVMLAGALGAPCAALTLDGQQEHYEAAPALRWLDAAGQRLTPDQALARLRDGGGQRLTANYPTLGFRDGDQWFLLSLTNRSADDRWYLNAARPHLDRLDLYLFDPRGQLLDHWVGGDQVPFDQRPLAHHQLVFPLILPPDSKRFLLFRAHGKNVIDFPLSLRSSDSFNLADGGLSFFQGFYFGAMAIMCLFNLLIFLSIREPSYLWYVFYLASFGINLFAREGLAYRWLWPGAPDWNQYSLAVLNLLTLSLAMLFSCSFLELRKRAPTLNLWLTLSAVVVALSAPLAIPYFDFFIQFSAALAFPWPFIAAALALWQFRQGYRPALFFLIAFATLAVTGAIYILKTFNLVPGHWMIENALQLGTFVEALLLSLALAHRMTALKSDNERIQLETNEALERRVEERTRELNAALSARGEFLAVISHEIRTPLNSIIGTVDMLRDSALDDGQRRHLHVIEQSGAALIELIDDVLDYSRLDAGKMPIDQTPFDLPALLLECITPFQQSARSRATELRLTLDPSLGEYCVGDPVRLRQILVNLIGNAVKFTDDGAIDVSARREEANRDYVLFEVRDTGIGIASAQLPMLFTFFQQAGSGQRRHHTDGGSGLGLAICRQLAEIMGGQIGVESQEYQGSLFWVRLPLPAAATGDRAPTAPALETGPAARLLIVDDNHVNLLVAEGLCRKLGHECETAESGAEALATLLARPDGFDLVLMDCEMPDPDGFETTRAIHRLQREGRLPVIPVIALTAHAVPEKIAACHDAGMIGHIAKPVNLQRLNQALSAALRGIAGGDRPFAGSDRPFP